MNFVKEDNYYNNLRHDILKYIPNDIHRVLDVGCGSGEFGKLLKKNYGCIVYGIEPNEKAAQKASNSLDKVIIKYFDKEINLNSEMFDCIFFNDVLEHFNNPAEALLLAKKLLNKNGYLIASIPNLRNFRILRDLVIKGDFKYQKSGILDETHLRFFTRKSIERLFSETGYDIKLLEGINPIPGRKYRIINLLTDVFNRDIKFNQFVITATIK